jgi:hypothetical protein
MATRKRRIKDKEEETKEKGEEEDEKEETIIIVFMDNVDRNINFGIASKKQLKPKDLEFLAIMDTDGCTIVERYRSFIRENVAERLKNSYITNYMLFGTEDSAMFDEFSRKNGVDYLKEEKGLENFKEEVRKCYTRNIIDSFRVNAGYKQMQKLPLATVYYLECDF